MSSVCSIESYRFGSFELELKERRLLKNGHPVALRPRAFDLLGALVDRAGHLVTKNDLLDRVWPKMVVEEAVVRVQVSALRKVLGNHAIATISGQGYRFTLPVMKVEASPKRTATVTHNLPCQLTSFIGRDQEIAQLAELLNTNRLVTLTGAGGTGKTRLAIEAASRSLDAFPDGAWLVELAELSDPRLLPGAVAQALDVQKQPSRSIIETLADYFVSKRLLLVFDNAEHLLEECAQFMDRILHRSPNIVVLLTSRERLGIRGEVTYRVPSLTVPEASKAVTPEAASRYEAVRLFIERARLVRSGFALTVQNASAVATICRRLDGMPLAIELAATRLRSMSLEELNQRLDQGFALLTDVSRTALPRHRTLRSMLDWSFGLLTEHEKAMLHRVAVFAGGWTVASAEQVCAGHGIAVSDVIEHLTSLVDKSLILIDEHAGATRFRMIETVRQYALDRLRESGEEAQWRRAHLACFAALAEELLKGVEGAQQHWWSSRIAGEHDNLRAALAWSAEAGSVDRFRLASALQEFECLRGRLAEEGSDLSGHSDGRPLAPQDPCMTPVPAGPVFLARATRVRDPAPLQTCVA